MFLYLPLSMIVLLSFNTATSLSFPPKGFTLKWWSRAADNHGARDAFWNSVQVAVGATLVALVLGTLASLAVQRYRSSPQHVEPRDRAADRAAGHRHRHRPERRLPSGRHPVRMLTLIIAHATFCIVVLYNNSLARLRRLSPNLEEASADLGAHSFQTYRYVTFPLMRTALLAGGLLAFGLSFDEIVVTTFTSSAGLETLPLWIFNNLSRGEQAPIVTVVASVVMLISIIPVWLAQRLTSGDGPVTGGTR